jgi:hypothetical protein
VLGGVLSVILSLFLGFQLVLVLALAIYGLSGAAFYAMRRQERQAALEPPIDVQAYPVPRSSLS